MIKKISVAHSPDADDIFMYYALKLGWVSQNRKNTNKHIQNIVFDNIALDIETLNVEALKNTYDISAISFALYPKICNNYALLRTAVSFGEGYGPKLVKRKGTLLKKNFKVALSGQNTTNALLFKISYPNARIIYKNFLDIEQAVLDGEVDAGVLIHESILNFSDKLEVECEIWDIWRTLAKEDLPLPLGGMAIRKSIPLHRAIECEKILTDAVKIANEHKKILSKELFVRNLIRVNDEELEKYLNMYASNSSVCMDYTQLKAINRLFEIGYENNFYDKPIDVNDFLIPIEYKILRDS